jgi:hypothetical protein
MNIDSQKAKQLGCTSTCPVPLRMSDGEMVTHDLPCTPHNHGLCVVLTRAGFDVKKDVPIIGARVTHVASGFALTHATLGDYPATKTGMAAALYELDQLLPITDWTRPADELKPHLLAAEVVTRRCRAAFPGKLVGNVVARDTAEPPAEIVKWRVYSQDTTTGWSFVELAHEDHLLSAVDEALTKTGTSAASGPMDDVRRAMLVVGTQHPFDFDHDLRLYVCADGRRDVVVNRTDRGFDLCCEQRAEMVETLSQAERELSKVTNPRKVYGVWKSGPKFGALKLPAKLPPAECVETLAQQDRYDAAARKVEAFRADLRHIERLLAASEPIPERVTKLCPRETPGGKEDAIKLLGFLKMQCDSTKRFAFGTWSSQFMFDKCIAQLERGLREYESVEQFGFAPRSRCMFIGDPRDGETDCEVEIEDVIVSRGDRWSTEPTWWHERDVIESSTGHRFTVSVERLRATS